MPGVPVQAQEMIMVCTIAPKTGPFAGSVSVAQWPNDELWVKQVNGGLRIGDNRAPIQKDGNNRVATIGSLQQDRRNREKTRQTTQNAAHWFSR